MPSTDNVAWPPDKGPLLQAYNLRRHVKSDLSLWLAARREPPIWRRSLREFWFLGGRETRAYGTDNPADDRIRAALGTNNTQRQHFKALHHSKVFQALETIHATNAWPATIYCFEFLTLCAVRSGEARLATWDEIDLPSATWTISGQRTKTGKPHRVPLSTSAPKILNRSTANYPTQQGSSSPHKPDGPSPTQQ